MWPWVLILALALVDALIAEAVRPLAANHPWRVLILLAGASVMGFGLSLTMAGARSLMTGALVLVFAGCAWGLISGWDDRDNYLQPYCRYGAASTAELERCLARTRSDDIDRLDTPAARFARGETTECGRDAGPLCREPGAAD